MHEGKLLNYYDYILIFYNYQMLEISNFHSPTMWSGWDFADGGFAFACRIEPSHPPCLATYLSKFINVCDLFWLQLERELAVHSTTGTKRAKIFATYKMIYRCRWTMILHGVEFQLKMLLVPVERFSFLSKIHEFTLSFLAFFFRNTKKFHLHKSAHNPIAFTLIVGKYVSFSVGQVGSKRIAFNL